MSTSHTRYQSESTLKQLISGFEQRYHAKAQEAYDAATELERRRMAGGERCTCCNGSGWFKERGSFSNDEICEDCSGVGTVYRFPRGQ
ncbi:hypothetical protein [Staphylococcus aureus]|uniref:hypothetical protein n=1 Tax=Staphylococcus aureus TaxID=1280 RepID=UPI0012A35B64|nr:hypothetical protein [Staphylococcus aureus]AYD82564.1 chaperone protein [Achromobacter phage vB_Ade_ART]MBD4204903.1 hypothetical protein [Xanthomonas citri pv. citri]